MNLSAFVEKTIASATVLVRERKQWWQKAP
jgi:hypothetical protein